MDAVARGIANQALKMAAGGDPVARDQAAQAQAAIVQVATPESQGAQAGDADHTAKINAAINTGRPVRLDLASYNLKPGAAVAGITPNPAVLLKQGARVDGNGATLSGPNGGRLLFWRPDYQVPDPKVAVAGDIAAGATAVPLVTGGGATFAAGDTVLWRLNDVPYDRPETLNWGIAKVSSVAGDTLTLDRPITRPFTLATAVTNKHIVKPTLLRNAWLHDFTIDGQSGVEDGIEIAYATNLTIERVRGRRTGAGLIVGQYIQGATFSDIYCEDPNLTQTSYGACIAVAESRDINVRSLRAVGMRQGIKAEAGSEVNVGTLDFTNTRSTTSDRSIVINALGLSTVIADQVTVRGYGASLVVAQTGNGQAGFEGTALIRNLRMDLDAEPYQVPPAVSVVTGTLDMTIAGTRSVYDMALARWWERIFFLEDGEYLTVLGNRGILAALNIYVSAGVTLGAGNQVTSFYVGREGDNGTNRVAQLTAGSEVRTTELAGTSVGIQWPRRDDRLQVLVVTGASAGLTNTGAFIRMRALQVPKKPLAALTGAAAAEITGYTDADALREAGANILEGKITYDPPSIAAGDTTTISVPLTGAVGGANGDTVIGVGLSSGLGGLQFLSAEITSGGGSVTVTLKNSTAAAIDRGSGTLRVMVQKRRLGQ